jgi:hypothetical protein
MSGTSGRVLPYLLQSSGVRDSKIGSKKFRGGRDCSHSRFGSPVGNNPRAQSLTLAARLLC